MKLQLKKSLISYYRGFFASLEDNSNHFHWRVLYIMIIFILHILEKKRKFKEF